MRKHFLILMLMALLPLASWGSTLDPLGIQAKNINYGYIVTEDLTELLHSDIEGSLARVDVDENVYKKSGNMYTAVCHKEGVKDLVVGTYYLKVTGKEGDPVYEGATDYLVFLVNPYDISEDATFTVSLTIPGAGYTYDGTAKNPTYAVAWTGHTLNTNDYEVATTDNVAAGTNTAKVTVTGKGNLTGTKTAKFSIAALEVNTTDFTITPNKTSFVYNSEVQKPTFTVKYGETVLEEDDGETVKDYSITWSGDSKNYADYTATINFHGNFKDPDVLLAMQTQEYTINQATLFVEANATRPYDGATGWSDLTKNDIDFTYIGWQGNDEEKYTAASPTITIGIDWTEGETEALSNVLTLQDATIKDALAETHISIDKTKFSFAGTDNHNNYKIQGKSTGKLTIAKKTGLTLTFDADITKDKGETTTLDEVKAVLTTNAIEADRDAVKAAVTAFAIGTEPDEDGKYDITLTVNNTADVFANYDMTAFVAGTGKIKYNNATLYVSLKTASLSKLTKVYDGTEPDLTAISAADFDIDGWVAGDETALTIAAQFTTEGNHVNVANYPVNFNVTGVPAGYDLEVSAATYKVTKRPIQFTIAPQYLAVGDAVSGDESVFDKTLFTVSKVGANPASGLASSNDKDAIFALDLQANFKQAPAIEGDPYTFKNNPTEDAPLTKAIKIVLVDETLANNYSWEETFGVVNIAGGEILVLDEKADLTALTADNVTIHFANARTLKPKRWYAMCLPFETTVAKISQAFGYAIVDVLPENATGLNFKIAMGKIEAYRPFLIKIADAPGLTENDGDVNMNTNVEFTHVTIAAYNAEANPYFSQEVGDYYFNGTMKREAISSVFWTTGNKMADDAFEFDKFGKDSNLNALRAYIVGKTSTTSAPMITIEEADGSTTAINCINADGEAIEANGWYTLNGVKLQGVPTEKGIYIHNGKKLVVK